MAIAIKRLSKEEEQIYRVVKRVLKRTRPPSVLGSDVELGQDSTDRPAVWISLKIDKRSKLTKKELDQIDKVARLIKLEIFRQNLPREPYVRLRTAA